MAAMERFAARVATAMQPIQRVVDKVTAAYGRIATASSKIAGSLRSASDSLKKILDQLARVPGLLSGVAKGSSSPSAASGGRGGGGGGRKKGSDEPPKAKPPASKKSGAGASGGGGGGGLDVGDLAAIGSAVVDTGQLFVSAGELGVEAFAAVEESLFDIVTAVSTATMALLMLEDRGFGPWQAVKSTISGVASAISTVGSLTVSAAKTASSALYSLLSTGVSVASKVVSAVTGLVSRTASAIGSGLAGILSSVRGAVTSAISGAVAGLENAGIAADRLLGPLKSAAEEYAAAAVAALELAKSSQMSVSELTALQYAAQRSGVSVDKLIEAIGAGELESEVGITTQKLEQFRNEALRLGLVMDGDTAAAAKALSDANQMLKDSFTGLWRQVGAAVLPQLAETAKTMVDLVTVGTRWLANNKPLVAQAFKWASAVSAVAAGMTVLTASIIPAIPLAAGLATAVGAGAAAWWKYGDQALKAIAPVRQAVGVIWAETSRIFGGVMDAVKGGDLELAVSIAWTGIQKGWTKGLIALAGVTSTGIGGVMNALAAGDWKSAGEQAWGQVQIAFTAGMSAMEQLWTQLKNITDQTLTYVQQAWNTALRAIAKEIDALLGATSNVLATLAAYDPSGQAAKAAQAINRLGTATSRAPSSAANAELQRQLDERTAARNEAADTQKARRDAELAALRGQADQRAGVSAQNASGRAVALEQKLAEALQAAEQARLQAQIQQAADIDRQKKQDDAAKGGQQASGGFGATFSAAALIAMGGRGQTRLERLAAQQLEQQKAAAEQLRIIGKNIEPEFV